jgi:uncharacterized protein
LSSKHNQANNVVPSSLIRVDSRISPPYSSQISSSDEARFPLRLSPRIKRWQTSEAMRQFLLALALILASSPSLADSPQLVRAAREQTKTRVTYDATYTRIGYPMGDVPADRGVCTDVVIRACRATGIDLQVLIHEDMRANFQRYPARWGLTKTDTNIDHRRVPNLQTFLERKGARLNDASAAKYLPGDLMTWMLPGNLPHIGIVSDREASDFGRPLIIHNIGAGTVEEDLLFAYPITGHYRYRVQ